MGERKMKDKKMDDRKMGDRKMKHRKMRPMLNSIFLPPIFLSSIKSPQSTLFSSAHHRDGLRRMNEKHGTLAPP